MTTEIHPTHRLFQRNNLVDRISDSFKALERDRGKTLERINVLRRSLCSIVSSRSRLSSTQFNRGPSKTYETLGLVGDGPIELKATCSDINDTKTTQKQSKSLGGIAPSTPATTTSCPIATSESLCPLSSNTLKAGLKGSQFRNCLLAAHKTIETLTYEKHKLERICLDYEEQLRDLRQRYMRCSGDTVAPVWSGLLEEANVSVPSQTPTLSPCFDLKVLQPDAKHPASLSSQENSEITLTRTFSFNILEPLLHLLHRLSFYHPEVLPDAHRRRCVKKTFLSPLDDQKRFDRNVVDVSIEPGSPEQVMMLDYEEEEVRQILNHLENILPSLISSSEMTASLTAAGANLLQWVDSLEDEVALHRTKLLQAAEKLERAKEGLKAQIIEKEASVKDAEKLVESLRQTLALMRNEFEKQQVCAEVQKEHIEQLSSEIKLLTDRQREASGIKELSAVYDGPTQETKRLRARISELEEASKTNKSAHTFQVEQVQCELGKTEHLLVTAEAECTRLTNVLEDLHQQQQNAGESTPREGSLGHHMNSEEEPFVRDASAVDRHSILQSQPSIDISDLLNAESRERQSLELLEQASLNDIFYTLLMIFLRNHRMLQQAEPGTHSRTSDFVKETLKNKIECPDSAVALVSEEYGSPTVLSRSIGAQLLFSSRAADLTHLMAELKSLEKKSTSFFVLLDDLNQVSGKMEQVSDESVMLDMCAPKTVQLDKEEDDEDTWILPQGLDKIQGRLERLCLTMDLLHCKLRRTTRRSRNTTKHPSQECHIQEQQKNSFGLCPQERGVCTVPKEQLPMLSLECLEPDSRVAVVDSNEAMGTAMSASSVSRSVCISWDLDATVAHLTRSPDICKDQLDRDTLEGGLDHVAYSLIEALGLVHVGAPSFALWGYFICKLQGLYQVQERASPLYCSEMHAAKASRLFGALVLQSGVLARSEVSLGTKWATAVVGLCQLLGYTTDINSETNIQNQSLRRCYITKQLIQSVEMNTGFDTKGHCEDSSTSFVPQHEDIDPTTMVYHLLSGDSHEVQKSFVVSCCVQLERAQKDNLLAIDVLSTTSLLQLFLMLGQEVNFFDPSTVVNSSPVACNSAMIPEEVDHELVSLVRCMLHRIDGHVLPLLLLVSQVLSHPSCYCLLRTLLTTRNALLERMSREQKMSGSTRFMSDPAVSSETMERFVQRIFAMGKYDCRRLYLPQ